LTGLQMFALPFSFKDIFLILLFMKDTSIVQRHYYA